MVLSDLLLSGNEAPNGLPEQPVLGDTAESSGWRSFSSDDVYTAIARGHIGFDLQNELLADGSRSLVYPDVESMQIGSRFREATRDQVIDSRSDTIREGTELVYGDSTFRVLHIDGDRVLCDKGSQQDELGLDSILKLYQDGKLEIRNGKADCQQTTAEVMRCYSPQMLEEALRRLDLVRKEGSHPGELGVSRRTLQRYRKAIRSVGDSLCDRVLALAPAIHLRGYRRMGLSQQTVDLITRVAKEHFNRPHNPSKKFCYAQFLNACEQEGVDRCSIRTFNRYLEGYRDIRAQKGKRWAYQLSPIVWYLTLAERIHGYRPFECVHIDHTQLDIELIDPETGKPLGKPWLTMAIDAESRAILAFYLAFEAPSYRSCMMIMRDMVRRFGRLPGMLVLDNGKEFHSGAFTRLCRIYEVSLRYRPAGQPRAGAVMERAFGSTNTEFIHLLEGNTKLLKNPRSLTKSVLPRQYACWTLEKLYGACQRYFFDVYGQRSHSATGEAPLDYLKVRMLQTGMRLLRLVRYDRTFLVETCPNPNNRATRVVDWQRGVKVNHLYYWCDAFRKGRMNRADVEVRYDPWDPGIVFALVDGEWVQCVSKARNLMRTWTEASKKAAVQEILARNGSRQKALTSERIIEWLNVLDPKTFDSDFVIRQTEMLNLYARMGLGRIVKDVQTPETPTLTCSGSGSEGPGEQPIPSNAVAEDACVLESDDLTDIILSEDDYVFARF